MKLYLEGGVASRERSHQSRKRLLREIHVEIESENRF